MSEAVPAGPELPFHFRAHGLDFSSEIDLPDAAPRPAAPADVVIRRGLVPDALDHAVSGGTRHRFAARQCLLNFPGVARYWVRDGREVQFAAETAVSDADLRVHLLSTVMGALAHQNGFFPLHASAIDVGGACVLFAGTSGAGKSTFAAACHARGYPVYSDDLATITADVGGQMVVHPGYRFMKLRTDAVAGLAVDLQGLRPLGTHGGKLHLALPHPPDARPLPIRAIFAITAAAIGTEPIPVQGADKVHLLVRETYRRRMLSGLGSGPAHFALASRIAEAVPLYRLPRPAGLDGVRRFVDRLPDWTPR